jgi:hypothetical protein
MEEIMKHFVNIVCLCCIVLIVGGCSSFGGGAEERAAAEERRVTAEKQRLAYIAAARRKEEERRAVAEEERRVAEEERRAAEAERKAAVEAERQQPRFSPEGQEYVKRTLTQAVGEANNPANRGKTLFFESSVTMESGALTGQWHVSSLESSGITLMEYYGQLPVIMFLPTILYRVEISNYGSARYVIDSFREGFNFPGLSH